MCVFFTTGRVGVWNGKEDEISVSGNTCASLDVIRKMQFSRIYGVNNLVFIKIIHEDENNMSRGNIILIINVIFEKHSMQPDL